MEIKNFFKNVKIKYMPIFEVLFFIGFALFAFLRAIDGSELIVIIGKHKSLLRIISFLLLIPKVISTKYEKKDIPMIVALYVTTILCIYFAKDKNIIIFPTIFIGLKNINIKKIINIIFTILSVVLIIHLIAFIIVYSKTSSFISMFHFSASVIKNKIMYMQNNNFAYRFACCIMQYIYLTDRDKSRYIKVVILSALSIFMLLISQSRASFIVCVMAILYLLIEKNINIMKLLNYGKYISIIFSIVVSVFLVYVGKASNNPILSKLSHYISGRPTLYIQAVDYVGIRLMPNVETFNNLSKHFGYYAFPDNSYISVLLKWGIIMSTLFVIIVYILISNRKNDNITNYYIIILAIWYIIENLSSGFIICFVPLLLFDAYFNREHNN